MVLAFHQRPDRLDYLTDGGTKGFLAAVSRNPNYAAYLTAAVHSEQNSLQPEALQWTSRQAALPPQRSFRSAAVTNSIQ